VYASDASKVQKGKSSPLVVDAGPSSRAVKVDALFLALFERAKMERGRSAGRPRSPLANKCICTQISSLENAATCNPAGGNTCIVRKCTQRANPRRVEMAAAGILEFKYRSYGNVGRIQQVVDRSFGTGVSQCSC
jgi:hypothetical protein